MIRTTNRAYLKEVIKFAKSIGKWEHLKEQLNYLGGYAQRKGPEDQNKPSWKFDGAVCTLYKDFAPYSFEFHVRYRRPESDQWMPGFYGGLIFYNAGESGVGNPQLSVRLNSEETGWSINT